MSDNPHSEAQKKLAVCPWCKKQPSIIISTDKTEVSCMNEGCLVQPSVGFVNTTLDDIVEMWNDCKP